MTYHRDVEGLDAELRAIAVGGTPRPLTAAERVVSRSEIEDRLDATARLRRTEHRQLAGAWFTVSGAVAAAAFSLDRPEFAGPGVALIGLWCVGLYFTARARHRSALAALEEELAEFDRLPSERTP